MTFLARTSVRITSYNVCYTKLLRKYVDPFINNRNLLYEVFSVITSYSIHYTKLYDAWGYAAPYWASPISPCPTGGIWILTHLWEYYLYTENNKILRNRIYPLFKEAVEFFKEYIFQDDAGVFLSGPSISPENSFCA